MIMLNERVLVLIIFFSVVAYHLVDAIQKCHIIDGFDIDKLDGTWHYVAGINPKTARIQCECLVLRRVSKFNLHGYKFGFFNGALRNMTITAYVRNNIMDLRTFKNGQNTRVLYMYMRTCNGNSEFVLESPKHNLYWIFSRYTTVTPIFLKNYRMLGKEIGLKLKRANRTHCPELCNQKIR